MLNEVRLIGNVGKDPEIKFLESGAVATFSLATTEKWKSKSGEKKELVSWHNIVAFGKLGEICGEYLKKGSKVFVGGKIKYESYEKDGETKYITKIIADNMKMLDGKAKTEGGHQESAPQSGPDGDSDDIPF